VALLEMEHLAVRYGGIQALDDVSFPIEEGKILGLIGPNGAGKTTLIDALAGMAPYKGAIRYERKSIDRWPPHRRSKSGIVRTFQSVELFRDLSVRENLLVYADPHGLAGAGRMFRKPVSTISRIESALDSLGVAWTIDRFPEELPHGTRRLVSIARALAARPRLLLLDEPAAGLDVGETRQLGLQLRRLVDDGITTIMLVDHDMDLIFSLCDYVHVLNFGKLLAGGRPGQVRENPDVLRAYLGAPPDPTA